MQLLQVWEYEGSFKDWIITEFIIIIIIFLIIEFCRPGMSLFFKVLIC